MVRKNDFVARVKSLLFRLVLLNVMLGLFHSISLTPLKTIIGCRCFPEVSPWHWLARLPALIVKRAVFTDLQTFENMALFSKGALALIWKPVVFLETLIGIAIMPLMVYVIYGFLAGSRTSGGGGDDNDDDGGNTRVKVLTVLLVVSAMGWVGVMLLKDPSYYPLKGAYTFISTLVTSPGTFTFTNTTLTNSTIG